MAGYFIPDRGWRRLLPNAVKRGVDVRVMFPHQNDILAMQWAAHATYAALLRSGVAVYEYLPSMLHAKVDRCIAIDRTSWARRGLLRRLVERFFYALRRWL
jgi:cardiolipin synthase